MPESLTIRRALPGDREAIRRVYNEGIEDRVATLDTDPKSPDEIAAWWAEHGDRFAVLVALEAAAIVGWASLNRFSHRCAHSAIADLSVYVARSHRGRGIGSALLTRLESEARAGGFYKIVLHALNRNEHGKRLYVKSGFREVGIFREHGSIDGSFVDVVAMEKLLG
jgi:L-amino acid N-acyltransferase YncA